MFVVVTRNFDCIFLTCLLFLIVSGILETILFFKNYHHENIDNIKTNFEIEAIFDLQVQEYCSVEYQPLKIDKWFGTKPGCQVFYRSENIFVWENSYIKSGGCENVFFKEDDRERKKHIPPVAPIDITKWRGKQICSKRRTNPLDYLAMLENSVKEGEECKEGYKKCGKLDSMNNIACMPKDDMCPINYIKVTDSQEPPSECINCKTIQLDLNYLHYGNDNINNSIVTNFKTSDDRSKVCLDQGEYNSQMKRYTLDNIDHYGCENEFNNMLYDERYTYLDTIPKATVFEDNGILVKIERLPKFPVESIREQQTSLFTRSFQGFDKQCLKQNGINLEQYEKLEGRVTANKWLTFVSLLFLIVNIMFIVTLLYKGQYDMSTFEAKIVLVLKLISLLFIIIPLILFAGVSSIMNECGDKYVTAMLSQTAKNIRQGKGMQISVIVFIVLCIALMVADDVDYWYSHRNNITMNKLKEEDKKDIELEQNKAAE